MRNHPFLVKEPPGKKLPHARSWPLIAKQRENAAPIILSCKKRNRSVRGARHEVSRNKGSSLQRDLLQCQKRPTTVSKETYGAPSPLGSLMGNSLSGTSLRASSQKPKSPLAGSMLPFAASFSVRSESLAQVRDLLMIKRDLLMIEGMLYYTQSQ